MTDKYVKVRIYEPTYTKMGLTESKLSKWDLMKIILFGTVREEYINYRGETYIPYKLDREDMVNVAHVKEEDTGEI